MLVFVLGVVPGLNAWQIGSKSRLFQEASLELEEEGVGFGFGVLDLGGKKPIAEFFEFL